jgi:hypothetical protein
MASIHGQQGHFGKPPFPTIVSGSTSTGIESTDIHSENTGISKAGVAESSNVLVMGLFQ